MNWRCFDWQGGGVMARTAGYPKGTARRPTTRPSGTNGALDRGIAHHPRRRPATSLAQVRDGQGDRLWSKRWTPLTQVLDDGRLEIDNTLQNARSHHRDRPQERAVCRDEGRRLTRRCHLHGHRDLQGERCRAAGLHRCHRQNRRQRACRALGRAHAVELAPRPPDDRRSCIGNVAIRPS